MASGSFALSPSAAGGSEGEGPSARAGEERSDGGALAGAPASPWPWLFQGREWNPHLRAYDFRARTLWPDLGRFGQEDPAGMTDSPNLYQALLGNWTGATDPEGFAVVMMHGIRDRGLNGNWANEMREEFPLSWERFGADPGQDVMTLVNVRRGRSFTVFGYCSLDTFCVQEAAEAGILGILDKDTRQAGWRSATMFARLRANLDSSRTRKGEVINVFAHSHGTAMLLSAARQNFPGKLFSLNQVILAGSDLHPHTSLDELVWSSRFITSFYSHEDRVANLVKGAGAIGFRDPIPIPSPELSRGQYSIPLEKTPLRRDTARFRQVRLVGIKHSADELERKVPLISWVSYQMTYAHYAEIFSIFTPRPDPTESRSWIDRYIKLREEMGIHYQIAPADALVTAYKP